LDQGSECQGFRHSEIHWPLAAAHFSPLLEKLFHLGVNVEALGIGAQTPGNRMKLIERNSCAHFVLSLVPAALIAAPVSRQVAQRRLFSQRASFFLRGLKLLANFGDTLSRILSADVLSVDLPQRRMVLNCLV